MGVKGAIATLSPSFSLPQGGDSMTVENVGQRGGLENHAEARAGVGEVQAGGPAAENIAEREWCVGGRQKRWPARWGWVDYIEQISKLIVHVSEYNEDNGS